MIWVILINIIILALVYLIITEDNKWIKILFTIILVVGIGLIVWKKPAFIYDNFLKAKIICVIFDVIGLIILLPKINSKEK